MKTQEKNPQSEYFFTHVLTNNKNQQRGSWKIILIKDRIDDWLRTEWVIDTIIFYYFKWYQQKYDPQRLTNQVSFLVTFLFD